MQQYGSATAQDLYRLFIKSGVFDKRDRFRHWELVDDDDAFDPVSDDWYVVVEIDSADGPMRRRIDAARLWAAILACGTKQIDSVPLTVAQRCEEIIFGRKLEDIRISPKSADVVMQVIVYGQVEFD